MPLNKPKEFIDFTSSPHELRTFILSPIGRDLIEALEFFIEDGRDRLETCELGKEPDRYFAAEVQGWVFACRYVKQLLENFKENLEAMGEEEPNDT